MADSIRTKAALKALFEDGDVPVGQDFSDLIESLAAFSTPYNAGDISGDTQLNYYNGIFQKASVTGTTKLLPPNNGIEGARLEIWLYASGANHDLDIDSSILIPSESTITFPITLLDSKTYILLFRHNGSAWFLVSFVGGY